LLRPLLSSLFPYTTLFRSDFWGFCLCDGRRIGKGGVSLYETVGGQMLPLSKQKLRNLIGDENNWAEAPGVYKQLVNDRVFQFRDIRQYEQLIQLLIKVRTPKLSKEAFRPSDRKSTRLNSSHVSISYAVFCLKKKTKTLQCIRY